MSVSAEMDPIEGYAATWLDDPAEALTGCLHAFGLKEEGDSDDDEEEDFNEKEKIDLGFLDDDDQFDKLGIRVGLDDNKDTKLGSPAKNKAHMEREEKEPVFELNEFVLGARVPLLKMRHIKTNMDIGMYVYVDERVGLAIVISLHALSSNELRTTIHTHTH